MYTYTTGTLMGARVSYLVREGWGSKDERSGLDRETRGVRESSFRSGKGLQGIDWRDGVRLNRVLSVFRSEGGRRPGNVSPRR